MNGPNFPYKNGRMNDTFAAGFCRRILACIDIIFTEPYRRQ